MHTAYAQRGSTDEHRHRAQFESVSDPWLKRAENGRLVLCEGVCVVQGLAKQRWPRSRPAQRPSRAPPQRTAGTLQTAATAAGDSPCAGDPASCGQPSGPPSASSSAPRRRPSERTVSGPEDIGRAWPVSVRLSVCSSFPLPGPHLGQTAGLDHRVTVPSAGPGERAVGAAARVPCGVRGLQPQTTLRSGRQRPRTWRRRACSLRRVHRGTQGRLGGAQLPPASFPPGRGGRPGPVGPARGLQAASGGCRGNQAVCTWA